jgi:hypothetical protein
MKKDTWIWFGVAAVAAGLLWYFTGGSASVIQLVAAVQSVATDDADNMDISFLLTNPTTSTLNITGFTVAVTYTNGSIGTDTINLSLAPGPNIYSLAVPIPASMQSDLEGAINNGGSGYVINLIGTSSGYGFSTSYNLP